MRDSLAILLLWLGVVPLGENEMADFQKRREAYVLGLRFHWEPV